jgi:hypothetical protein
MAESYFRSQIEFNRAQLFWRIFSGANRIVSGTSVIFIILHPLHHHSSFIIIIHPSSSFILHPLHHHSSFMKITLAPETIFFAPKRIQSAPEKILQKVAPD